MKVTRGAALLAAAAMTISGLAACGDEAEPSESSSTASPIDKGTESPSESSSPSSTTNGSASPSESDVAELPEEATKKTAEGAIAFNEFYQIQMGEALKTGDTSALERHSRGCAVCDGMVTRVDEYRGRGIHMNKNPNTVSDASARERSDGGYRVEVTVNASEYHEVLPDGSRGRTADPITMTIVSDTQWEHGKWVMRDQVRTQ